MDNGILDQLMSGNLPTQVKDALQSLMATPSWLDRAQGQTQRDIAAYQQGGIPALMADTGTTQDLAGGFGGITKNVGIKAYHGSPYDFDKFDLSKIGTGEGAQSYGHGLYFAENPKTAQAYRDAFEQGRLGIANGIDEYGRIIHRGKMYEVNINAKPEQFLDWDKPLSQQPHAVREIASPKSERDLNLPGSDVYRHLQNELMLRRAPTTDPMTLWNSPDNWRGPALNQVTAEMSQAGIPGIKYLDQGSRGAGTGTSNYVVFNPELIDILRKYMLPGSIAPTTALMATQGDQQQ